MDRADETSEPTAAPKTAPPSRQPDASGQCQGDAADGVAVAVVFQEVPQPSGDVLAESVQREGVALQVYADPPKPLPASAFLLPRALTPIPAPPPDWFMPIPPRGPGLSAGAVLQPEAPLPRLYLPPSVAGTIGSTDRPGRRAVAVPVSPPLTPDAALDEIDAEVTARSLSPVEAAIAEALQDLAPGGRHFKVPSPMIPAAFTPPSPPVEMPPMRLDRSPRTLTSGFGELVADPAARPDLAPREVAPRPPRDYTALAKRGLRIAGMIAAGWLALVLALILIYRFVNPPVSALMLQQMAVGQDVAHEWVDIEKMSPNIVRAVLLSEDGRFCSHFGVDYEAIQDAVEQAGKGPTRGASTISMQVVKNLFLWPSKSYLRKALELPLTYVMEFVWPKRRIMEVYLNIAEWGPGIFGIEMASQYHFRKPARNLSEREAARLAVALPNPLLRDAGSPGPGTQRLANSVQVRMRMAPWSQTACVLPKRRF